eukprot:scaffold2033_cov164-Amphora_coffeaeformis.AAC.14
MPDLAGTHQFDNTPSLPRHINIAASLKTTTTQEILLRCIIGSMMIPDEPVQLWAVKMIPGCDKSRKTVARRSDQPRREKEMESVIILLVSSWATWAGEPPKGNVRTKQQRRERKIHTQPFLGQELAFDTLEILRDWRDGHKWRRPFEMHGSMNLIWLCHTHDLQFGSHMFCLKIDLQNRALFHAFDNSFDGLVDQANARLLDPNDGSYDMAYVSRRVTILACVFCSPRNTVGGISTITT